LLTYYSKREGEEKKDTLKKLIKKIGTSYSNILLVKSYYTVVKL